MTSYSSRILVLKLLTSSSVLEVNLEIYAKVLAGTMEASSWAIKTSICLTMRFQLFVTAVQMCVEVTSTKDYYKNVADGLLILTCPYLLWLTAKLPLLLNKRWIQLITRSKKIIYSCLQRIFISCPLFLSIAPVQDYWTCHFVNNCMGLAFDRCKWNNCFPSWLPRQLI